MMTPKCLLSVGAVCALLVVVVSAERATACPFCSAASQTFSEDLIAADAVVLVKLLERGKPPAEGEKGPGGGLPGESTFQITKVIKGSEHLAGSKKVRVLYFGDADPETVFLITGKALPNLQWGTPIPLTVAGQKYVTHLLDLPQRGGDRLAFFQQYLENADGVLAQDAYDEFSKAPYSEVCELRGQIQHDKLVEWIRDPEVAPSHRRLYLTMLGICGTQEDLPMLVEMLKSSDRRQKQGLDALIACYLTLKGPEGMPLVEDLFLKNKKAEYADTYAAIMALRFHGQETKIIPKDRLLAGLRHMLDRPDLADLVISDLARWQSWSDMERLITLFKEADSKSSWVRVPVINFLQAAGAQGPAAVKQRASAAIDELAKIDPASVKQARSFGAFGLLAQPKSAAARPAAPAANPPADGKATSPLAAKASAASAGKSPQQSGGQNESQSTPASKPSGTPAKATDKSGGKTNTRKQRDSNKSSAVRRSAAPLEPAVPAPAREEEPIAQGQQPAAPAGVLRSEEAPGEEVTELRIDGRKVSVFLLVGAGFLVALRLVSQGSAAGSPRE